jgi:4'-phosphopantetheinyl transferase
MRTSTLPPPADLRTTPHCARLMEVEAPITLWLADLRQLPGDHALSWLSGQERARAARFHRDEHMRRYLAAHVALRLVIVHHTGLAPAEQRYERHHDGKWHLAGRACAQFSLSYADDVALIGIDPVHAVGVDIERERAVDDADDLAALHFNIVERARYAALAGPDGSTAFLGGWTRKEACLKAIGTGLHLPPATVHTGLDGLRAVTIAGASLDVGSFRHDGLVAAWARLR